MGSDAADGEFPRTVVHFGGATTIDAEPTRVIVIATGQLDSLLSLGVVPVGSVARDGADIVQPYLIEAFPQFDTELAAIESAGTNAAVNFEAIAALNPDLILANEAGSADIYDTLAALAPTVLTEGTGVNWKQDFLLLADALGRAGDAQDYLDQYHADAAALGDAVAGDPPEVSFLRFNSGRARVFGVPSFAGSVAWDAGLARPESQRFDDTSLDLEAEQLELVDGDWIFYSVQGAAEDTPAAAFLESPLWPTLNAVSAGHVVQVDDDPWFLSAGPTAARVVLAGLTPALIG